jgi:autotransporter-associated beta strand protein
MTEPASGEWSATQPNWNAGEVWPEGDGHTAVFGPSAQQSVTVSAALNVGAVRILSDGYRIGGAALTFSGAAPFIAVESAAVTSLLETAVLNDSLLSKTGPGLLRLGAAPYDGGTNVRDVAVAEGELSVEAGRTLCSTGIWSVAAGAAYRQSGGTNLLLSGGNVFVIGTGGGEAQTARVEVTGGSLLAPSAGTGLNAWFLLGKDRDAWFRMADGASAKVIVIEMNTDFVAGKSATLQLDGGRLTVNRITGSGGVSGTVSRVLLNGGEIYAGGSSGAFLEDMTEALVQSGGMIVNVPGVSTYYRTKQVLSHDPALGETPDGGLTKRGTANLHLQTNNTYTGTTRVEQGFLHVEANGALSSGPAEVGMTASDAALVGGAGSFTITNEVTFGLNGSVCAVTNGVLTLTDLAFAPGYEQIKVGGGKTDGTVRLSVDPASTSRVFNIFVYDRNDLTLDGGTVIRQTEPWPGGTTRVDVRAGSRLNVREADIQMPDISYLILSGGEYGQEGGQALFPYVIAPTNWPNSAQPELPARLVLDNGTLTFTSANMFYTNNRRGTETVVNGGTLKAKVLNLSKSVQQATVSHAVELNGGTLEVEGISYNGGAGAVEPATVRLNGGTLKVAETSALTNDFINGNGAGLLSVYLGHRGFVCDTAGKETAIRQPFLPDPGLGAAPDGGLRKLGAGCLTLTPRLVSTGPVTVEEGTLRLADAWLSGENIEVQAGGTLELYSGGISNAAVTVAAGGTLRLAQAAASAIIPNGSFETYAAGTLTSSVKHKYIPSGTGWTYSSGTTAGIQTNGSGFSSDPAYHTTNGGVTAMVKEGSLQTGFTVERDGTYRLSFEQATRNGYSSWVRNVDVRIDGITVYTVRHNGVLHGFLPVEVPVLLKAGAHTISFVGLYSSVENSNATVLIDAVALTGNPPLRFDAEAAGGLFRQVEAETTMEAPNGSFEAYATNTFIGVTHKYAPSGTGWTFSLNSTSGIQTNGSGFSDAPAFYTTNGGVTAFVKEGMIQTGFTVPRGGAYLLAFEQATRNGYSSWARNVEVRIDGVTVDTVQHNGQLHSFLPVEIPVQLTAGTHTLSFAGLYSAYDNANAAVLIDAIRLTRNNVVRTESVSVLNLSSGSTVILDNATSLYMEYIYADGVRLRGALRAGQSGGATVLGSGVLKTVPGGTMITVH